MSKSLNATRNDYLGQRMTVYTQHTMTHLAIAHPVFTPVTNNASETTVTEHGKSTGIVQP